MHPKFIVSKTSKPAVRKYLNLHTRVSLNFESIPKVYFKGDPEQPVYSFTNWQFPNFGLVGVQDRLVFSLFIEYIFTSGACFSTSFSFVTYKVVKAWEKDKKTSLEFCS